MLRSNINTEKSDFNYIKEADHVHEVWNVIEMNIQVYFNKMIEENDELAALKANSSFNVQSGTSNIRKKLSKNFETGLQNYKKEESKYKKFFSEESMHEFEDEDDPKAFKSALSTKVPVIFNARNSKRESMQEWKEKFATSKAVDVYAIFFNLIDFLNDYVNEINPTEFGEYNELRNLELLYTLNEDDDYNVPGVIGMGIKSAVLFHLNSTYFLGANKNTLYGFYFLSDCEHFNLPSRTNEFIMINDLKQESSKKNSKNLLIDQNYWYPYDLFILYSLRAFRKLKQLCAKHNYPLDDVNRFVHLNSFMSQIWNNNSEKIGTMTGGDQDDTR